MATLRGKLLGRAIGCVLVLALALAVAVAQEYPSKPVRLVVGFPPGGGTDIVARLLATKLAEALTTQVIVENRPGLDGVLGTEYVARSPADGYTLALAGMSGFVLSQFTYAKIPYHPINDFAPVTTVAMGPEILAVHPSLPAGSLKQLIALAKAQPGKLDFATSGGGGITRLIVELLKLTAKIDVQHVAYKGTAQSVTDALGGHVHGTVASFPVVYPHIKQGKLRGLVITSDHRNPLLPDLQTSAEQGLPALYAVNWYAVIAPAKTPRTIVEKLHGAFVRAATLPDVRERLIAMGNEPMTSSSTEAFTGFLKEELARWGKVTKAAGIQPE